MNLQTKINIPTPDFSIDYHSKMLLLGSCFAESMGKKFAYYKFDIDLNPCGIVYNPFSVANILEIIMDGKQLSEDDLLLVNGKWVSLFHHGAFSDADQEKCLEKINTRLLRAFSNMDKNDLLVITWGTSWVYHHIEKNSVVSNCHKIPAWAFHRYRLTVEEIVDRYEVLIRRLRETNPDLRVMFTVSPIRHWKDGAHGNQLSKAILLLAIDQLQEQLGNIYYFPAYEIVLDELRNYRFFADDMLHLSEVTIDYIWERLLFSYISPQVVGLMNRIERINKGMAHHPFEERSSEYRKLVEKLIAEIDDVTRIHPMINFTAERHQLQDLLVR